MIAYGFSIQGKSHITKNVVCQDANIIKQLSNGAYLAAVADGVGSAKCSDVGSKIAVEKIAEYCKNFIKSNINYDFAAEVLRNGYEYAFDAIREYVTKVGDRIEDYDTTLSVVIYDGKKVVYGHAGDGGIIVRLVDGRFVPITERQKGEDGISVRPLRAGVNSWEFGVLEKDVMAVLLATDGMLDEVFMPYLLNLPESIEQLNSPSYKKNNVCVSSAMFFMEPHCVYKNKFIAKPDDYLFNFIQGNYEEKDKAEFTKCMQNAYSAIVSANVVNELVTSMKKYLYPMWATRNVTDDKTVACIMNEKYKIHNEDYNYYREPDWKELQEHYDNLVYGNSSSKTQTGNKKDTNEVGYKSKINALERKMSSIGNEMSTIKNQNMIRKKFDVLIVIFVIVISASFVVNTFSVNSLKKEVGNKVETIEDSINDLEKKMIKYETDSDVNKKSDLNLQAVKKEIDAIKADVKGIKKEMNTAVTSDTSSEQTDVDNDNEDKGEINKDNKDGSVENNSDNVLKEESDNETVDENNDTQREVTENNDNRF